MLRSLRRKSHDARRTEGEADAGASWEGRGLGGAGPEAGRVGLWGWEGQGLGWEGRGWGRCAEQSRLGACRTRRLEASPRAPQDKQGPSVLSTPRNMLKRESLVCSVCRCPWCIGSHRIIANLTLPV